MKALVGIGMGMVAGAILGAGAVTALHAQTKASPVFLVSEVAVTNPEGYGKEFAPKVQPSIKAHGGRIVALGGSGGGQAGKVTSIQGAAPQRVAIQQWESIEAVQKWWNSEDYKAARQIGDKYATFRIFVVDAANVQ